MNIPAHGHVNSTLPIVQELVRRGEQVVYYLTEEFRSVVEATGATFRPYQSLMGQMQPHAQAVGRERMGPGEMPLMMVKESRQVLTQVLETLRADQPDVIVYDIMCLWGRIAVQVLQVPAILVHPSYVANEHFSLFQEYTAEPLLLSPELTERTRASIADLCATYNTPPFDMRQFFTHAETLNIVFMARDFQPAGETFDERFVFVGPSLQLRQEVTSFPFERLGEQPVLYISLGTLFNHRPDFYQLCFQAFGGQPWQVVLSHGKQVDVAALGAVPANFLLSSYVPQLEILQKASVFLTHGGMNSIMESLYYGVPMVVIPQMLEQEVSARRVATFGLGVHLDEEHLTVAQLRKTVAHVQHDSTTLQRVQRMQKIVQTAGGYQQATDAILHFARAGQVMDNASSWRVPACCGGKP